MSCTLLYLSGISFDYFLLSLTFRKHFFRINLASTAKIIYLTAFEFSILHNFAISFGFYAESYPIFLLQNLWVYFCERISTVIICPCGNSNIKRKNILISLSGKSMIVSFIYILL